MNTMTTVHNQDQAYQDAYLLLRRIAQGLLRKERLDHSLETTDLVHEYITKLALGKAGGMPSPEEYVDLLRQGRIAMVRILVDHARRRKQRLLRERHSLEVVDGTGRAMNIPDLEQFDMIVARLREHDDRKSAVLQLRWFCGLTMKETADAMGISLATAERVWKETKDWLRANLTPDVPQQE